MTTDHYLRFKALACRGSGVLHWAAIVDRAGAHSVSATVERRSEGLARELRQLGATVRLVDDQEGPDA